MVKQDKNSLQMPSIKLRQSALISGRISFQGAPMHKLTIALLFLCFAAQLPGAAAQSPAQSAMQSSTDLDAMLANLQKVAGSADSDIQKLRFDLWKTGDTDKQQMQEVAGSLLKNLSRARPGLIAPIIGRVCPPYESAHADFACGSSAASAA